MEENTENIIDKASITVSRNTPVGLVVGAAGFLGSHLGEKLLDHKIQVIGVDNLKTGKKENLSLAIRDSHFHFINTGAESLTLSLPRLDYIFIVAGEDYRINRILSLAKEYKSKIIFISWIDLYDHKSNFTWFKKTESEIASFAKEHNLNARVLRLSAIFGPRMNFKVEDPMVSLILAALRDKRQEESTALDFSTRALFIDDATHLIIKSMLSGATAWKIFDGVSPTPVKISEIKQILLDPVWHENRGFAITELPPWTTPNLERTERELHWHPRPDLIKDLKETLNYFKEHDISFDKEEKKVESRLVEDSEPEEIKPEKKQRNLPLKKVKLGVMRMIILTLFFFAFIYPVLVMVLGLGFINLQISSSLEHFKKGDFETSLVSIRKSKEVLRQVEEAINPFIIIGNASLPRETNKLSEKFEILNQTLLGMEHLNVGSNDLYLSFKAITGEKEENPDIFFEDALVEFQAAQEVLQSASINSKDENIATLNNLASENYSLIKFLPMFVSGEKNYLVILQDNSELRPTGGLISSIGLLTFKDSKLKSIEIESPASIDEKLKPKVAPPKEITEDLGKLNWDIEDANWEANFPSSATQISSFYTQATGVKIDGVVVYDLSAAGNYLEASGELSLGGRERIGAKNLMAQATIKQGSEFASSFNKELLNRVFFGSSSTLPKTVNSISQSLASKHLLLALKDNKLMSLLPASFTGKIPGPGALDGDILALVEANMGKNKANYYLDRSLSLEITKNENKGLTHRLAVNLTNRSPNQIWPGGSLKDRIRVFVPYGSKLISVKWGETDITSRVTALVDYSRTVWEFSIDLEPKEAKSLNLNYQTIKFDSLTIIKQPGTEGDNLQLTLPSGKTDSQPLLNDLKIAL